MGTWFVSFVVEWSHVPDGGGADAAKGGDDPREEEAAARGGARGVFGGFFGGAGGDDGVGVKGGGSGIGREERATDGEVDGGGVFRGEGGEDEVDFGGGGEGRVEVDGGGGVEACFGAEVMGDEAGEVVVSAVAKRAGAAGDLMVAVDFGLFC